MSTSSGGGAAAAIVSATSRAVRLSASRARCIPAAELVVISVVNRSDTPQIDFLLECLYELHFNQGTLSVVVRCTVGLLEEEALPNCSCGLLRWYKSDHGHCDGDGARVRPHRSIPRSRRTLRQEILVASRSSLRTFHTATRKETRPCS